MDTVTQAVRAMYSAYPYPAGGPVLRQGSDVRLLLSHVERGRQAGRPLRVLDAGCGRGVGLVASAQLQPDVDFLGVDLCARSLEDARAEVENRSLANVRLQELDLMTLEGLDVPEGGFDSIVSSGVVHHLSDPVAGLRRLGEVLAPHGVLTLMVYGRHGRENLYRLVRAIDSLVPRGGPLEERLALARELVRANRGSAIQCGPFQDQNTISDVEFVDRYLNVHETSYDIPALFDLIEAAGLRFLRWAEPADWDVDAVLSPGPIADRARALPERQRYALVDQLAYRPSLELRLVRPENGPRAAFDPERSLAEPLAWSPETRLTVERRNLRSGQRIETVQLTVRRRPPLVLQDAAARVALLLEDQQQAFLLPDLMAAAAQHRLHPKVVRRTVAALVKAEALYRPHLADV
jgi:SAM-dependent methyltransferase